MNSSRDLFQIKGNLGLVIKGQVHDLEALLQEIRDYVGRSPGMQVVFSEFSGDRLFIRKGGGP